MSRSKREAGYALLLIYAMAATVAIMLYMQLPRVAFEAQRDREQLLIDRGEQYSRAVQLYVRKYNRFPADIKALENTQNIRFLRKQYVDPMTGKSEWRLIHVGPGGVFTDSKVHAAKKDANAPQTFITELQQIGGNPANPTEGVNLANRRRPSDQPGAPGDPNGANAGQQNAGQPGAPPVNGPVMVLPDGRIVPATPTGTYMPPPATPPGGQPGATAANGFAPGTQAPSGIGVQPGVVPNQPGFQNQPNIPQGGPQTGAANLINQILTTPRPLPGQPPADAFGQNPAGTAQNGNFGGLGGQGNVPNNTGTPIGQGMGGTTVGGGFAGVASKYQQEGIKVYNDRTSYDEWEFVYDMTKDPARGGGRGAGQPTGQPVPQQPGLQSQQSGFGSAPPGGTPPQ